MLKLENISYSAEDESGKVEIIKNVNLGDYNDARKLCGGMKA